MSFYTYNRWQQLATVNIDAAAIPGFLGAASTDGVLRIDAPLTYTDGGDYITLGLDTTASYTFGSITVDSGVGQSIIIKGTSTGNANVGWIGFYDSDGTTRRGHIGDGASNDDDIYIGADTGYLRLLAAGYISLETHTYFPDDVVMSFGASLDYSIGFAVATDTLQIVDGTTLGSNVRLKLDSSGHFDFGAGNLTTTGTLGCGVLTSGNIVIPDAGTIGAVSDTDAIQIEADGDVVLTQDLAVTGTLGITGTVTIPTALTGVIRADSGVLSVDGDVTDIVTAATLTAQGKIEIATGAETNTGTDATRAVSPDGLEDWTGSAQIATVGTLSSGDVTAQVSAASPTAAGKVELAIDSEVNTGTSTALAVSPDALAGSIHGTKVAILKCVDDATAPTVTDTSGHITIPIELNGMNLVSVGAHVYTASGGSGPVALHIYNLTQTADMLSTGMTIDDTETDTATAGTPAVIDTNNDDVATTDVLQIHVTDIGDASTRGLEVRMGFRLP